MNILLILCIVVIWLLSIFTFAKWRSHSKAQNGSISVSVIHDNATNSFVMVTAAIVLVSILFLI
mgnify:FL=1|jgi:hypothetical protein